MPPPRPASPQSPGDATRVLLVQCCHPVQWLYVWNQLARQHPEWRIEGLAADDPDSTFYAERLAPGRVIREGDEPSEYQLVLLPLLNRGHFRMKMLGRRLAGRKLIVGYDGETAPCGLRPLLTSLIRPRYRPTPAFVAYARSLPQPPLGSRVLELETRYGPLASSTAGRLEVLRRPTTEIVRTGSEGFVDAWRTSRRGVFDTAVVYLSGDRDPWLLRLIPLLRRIPRIVVFDERGECFVTDPIRFLDYWVRRSLRRQLRPPLQPRVLLVQTESPAYVRAAVKQLSADDLFPEAKVLLVCRDEDIAAFEDLVESDGIVLAPLSKFSGIGGFFEIRREIRRFSPHFNVGIFTGRPFFRREKAAYFLAGSSRRFVFNAQLDGYWLTPRTFSRVFRREPLLFGLNPSLAERILLVQTESVEYTREAIRRMRRPKLFPDAEITLLCRESDRSRLDDLREVDKVLTYRKGQSLSSLFALRRHIRELRPQIKVGLFSGRPIFRPAKLLYFLSPARKRFVFNGHLEGYWLTPRAILRPLRRDFVNSMDPVGPRVVLFQTEVDEYVRAAVKRLQEPRSFPRAEILLVCRREPAEEFARLPGVVEVATFPADRSIRSLWRLWRRIRGFGPDFRCAILTGRPIFRAAKLLYLFSGLRRAFVLNASLDGYWLGLRNLHRPFRREPLLFGKRECELGKPELLLFETGRIDLMKRVISTVQQPHVAGGPRVTVFCHSDRSADYLATSGVDAVLTYSKANLWTDLKSVWRAVSFRPQIAGALFSGERVFLGHKILFWLTPSRNRLAFNRAIDCFYVNRHNIGSLLHRQGGAVQSAFAQILRPPVKALLFLPRFAYLKIWVALNRR